MVKIDEKFTAAISDTDILLDLFRCDSFHILSLLFKRIFIPEFIYKMELIKVARNFSDISFDKIRDQLEVKDGLFEIVYDSNLDIQTKVSRKALVQERKDLAGPGEVQCVCLAKASSIDFVVSNNHTEFDYLNDLAVMLTYYHILSVCVLHEKIDEHEASSLYDRVNSQKSKPSSHTFKDKLNQSKKYFKDNCYLKALRLDHLELV